MALAPPRVPALAQSVYYCFRQSRLDGTWERMHAALRERDRSVSTETLRAEHWHIVDSQSVKTTGVGGEHRGYDGGLTATSEAFIYVAVTRVMVRRLARAQ